MLNFKKISLSIISLKNFRTFDKNLSYSIPFLNSNNFIQLSNLSKKKFVDIPILFLKSFLCKKYKMLNSKIISKYVFEQLYESSFTHFKLKFYSWKLKKRFFFFYLHFNLKKKLYLNRFIIQSDKIFSSFVFCNLNLIKNYLYLKHVNIFHKIFFFLNLVNNKITFISFFVTVFNKFLLFTCLGFKMFTFKKYKKFMNLYLTLNVLNIHKFYIFKINQLTFKKFFRFNFYFKFV